MSTDGRGTKCRRNIAKKLNRLSRVHERYRQTDRRQTNGREAVFRLLKSIQRACYRRAAAGTSAYIFPHNAVTDFLNFSCHFSYQSTTGLCITLPSIVLSLPISQISSKSIQIFEVILCLQTTDKPKKRREQQ